MGNSRSSGRPSEKLAETEKALATVSRQRVEDLWSVCASDKLFITGAEALGFLEMLVQSLGVTMERETMQRLVAPFGDQVSHEDLHNLLFLAQDDLEEAEVAISDSLHRNFARLELPVRHVDLALLEQTELLHSTAGIATWRAHWREDGRAALLRVHSMSYLRRELDLHGVIEQMRRLHCQIALRYVGHSMEREDLVIIYEDPGSVHLLSSLLESGRWHAPPASVRKMFLRFAKGLLWLDTRKDLRHLQLRPDTVFVSTTGSTKLWCFVGEHLLKKRFDMVNLELLGGVVAYCSPEMLRGEGFDASPADVFALGLLMHATLTGREPFAGLEAADVMEQLLRGERPPLEGAGELAEVVAAAWRQDPAERASMAQLLEMLRRPLRSLRAGASMMGMPRRAPQSPPTQPQRRAHQSPPPRVQAPSSRSSELRQQLVASSPVAMQRLVPPLRHMPSPSVPVPVPVPAPALATLQGDSGGKASSRGSGGSSGKPRSASLSSSSYSPDEEERVPQRAVPVSLPAAPLYLYNGGMMPHVKGTKMENAPAGELWYSLPLAPNSQVQFRVYPVLSTFEMRSLKQHWTKLWSLRDNAGVLPFVGAVTRPFVAELWTMGTRLELGAAADWPAFFLVELCASMAAALHSLHLQHVNTLGSLALGSFVLERQEQPIARLMLAPVVFKLSSSDVHALPPEVLQGEPWSAKADVFALGQLISRLAAANVEAQLPRSRIFLKLLQHCVLEASRADPLQRADAGRLVQIIETAIR